MPECCSGHKDACNTSSKGGYGHNTSCPNFGIDKPMTAALTRTHRRAYFASLSYTDELIGNVVAALDATHLVENTVVALWGECSYSKLLLGVWLWAGRV